MLLSKDEYAFISLAAFLPEKFKTLLFSAKAEDNHYCFDISEEQADEIRDLCGEQLQLIGFDQNYELTPDGIILESLVDKLFYG